MATIAVFPEPGAWGPTNNLVAITEPLRERGHRIVFVVEESFAASSSERGFEEALMRVAPAPEQPEAVGEGWAESSARPRWSSASRRSSSSRR